MKRISYFFATLMLFSTSAFGIDLGINASYWDTKDSDAAWGMGAKVGIPFFIDRMQIEARAYRFNQDEVALFGDVDITPIDLGLIFYLTMDETVNPYLIGGVSYNFVDTSEIGLDSDFGYYLGAGLELPLGEGFALTGEALFRTAEFDAKSNIDDSFETSGMTINTGLKFRF